MATGKLRSLIAESGPSVLTYKKTSINLWSSNGLSESIGSYSKSEFNDLYKLIELNEKIKSSKLTAETKRKIRGFVSELEALCKMAKVTTIRSVSDISRLIAKIPEAKSSDKTNSYTTIDIDAIIRKFEKRTFDSSLSGKQSYTTHIRDEMKSFLDKLKKDLETDCSKGYYLENGDVKFLKAGVLALSKYISYNTVGILKILIAMDADIKLANIDAFIKNNKKYYAPGDAKAQYTKNRFVVFHCDSSVTSTVVDSVSLLPWVGLIPYVNDCINGLRDYFFDRRKYEEVQESELMQSIRKTALYGKYTKHREEIKEILIDLGGKNVIVIGDKAATIAEKLGLLKAAKVSIKVAAKVCPLTDNVLTICDMWNDSFSRSARINYIIRKKFKANIGSYSYDTSNKKYMVYNIIISKMIDANLVKFDCNIIEQLLFLTGFSQYGFDSIVKSNNIDLGFLNDRF